MKNGYAWHVRDDSNAERVHHEVEYLTSEGHKYIDLDLHVHYSPPSRNTVPDGTGRLDISSYTYTYEDNDMDLHDASEDHDAFDEVGHAPF